MDPGITLDIKVGDKDLGITLRIMVGDEDLGITLHIDKVMKNVVFISL